MMPAETLGDIFAKIFGELQSESLDKAAVQSDRVLANFSDRFEFPEVSRENKQVCFCFVLED